MSWPVSPRAMRRGGLGLFAAVAVVVSAAPAVLAGSSTAPDWTKQAPATSPSARDLASMAYDAATGTIVLFGGSGFLGDTWTWDGSTWAKQTPTTRPPARVAASMAYDAAARDIVLFGGSTFKAVLDDTWTWGDPGQMPNRRPA